MYKSFKKNDYLFYKKFKSLTTASDYINNIASK
jgi:hypothetical protein